MRPIFLLLFSYSCMCSAVHCALCTVPGASVNSIPKFHSSPGIKLKIYKIELICLVIFIVLNKLKRIKLESKLNRNDIEKMHKYLSVCILFSLKRRIQELYNAVLNARIKSFSFETRFFFV